MKLDEVEQVVRDGMRKGQELDAVLQTTSNDKAK